MKKERIEFLPHGIKIYPPDYKEPEEPIQPLPDPHKKLREWKFEDYNETSEPEVAENYNGFQIQIRFSCNCNIHEYPNCGLKFFIITDNKKYYTDAYIYTTQSSAQNAAYSAIDNGEIPE